MPAWVNVDMVMIAAETLAAEHLLAHPLMRRNLYGLRVLITVAFCLLAAALAPAPKATYAGPLLYLGISALSGLSLSLCYQEDFFSLLFCTVSGYTIHHALFTFYECLTLSLTLAGWQVPALLLYIPSALIVYILCWILFTNRIKLYGKIQINSKPLFTLACVATLIDIFFRITMLHVLPLQKFPSIWIYLDIVVISFCAMILAIQYILLSNRKLEGEVQTMRRILSEGEKQYQLSRDSVQVINLKCHDLKHQIRQFRETHHSVDQQFLQEIENAVGIYDAMLQTGNEALDTILSEKSLACEKNHINLTCMVDGHTLDFILPMDIYSLFGNILDNAIEAVSSIQPVERRSISVNIRTINHFPVIHVQNYFEGNIRMVDGLPQTKKADPTLHGYGMKSIRILAEKYQGTLSITTNDQIFSLKILFALPPGPEE